MGRREARGQQPQQRRPRQHQPPGRQAQVGAQEAGRPVRAAVARQQQQKQQRAPGAAVEERLVAVGEAQRLH